MTATSDAIVVGGGLAGAAVALSLASVGCPVTLLEKSKGAHHKVCGEFLSYEALHYLRGLGVDVEALGAVPIRRLRFVGQHRCAEAALPFSAFSLSRCCLDEHLLHLAAGQGVTVLRDHHVQEVSALGHGWQVTVRGRERFQTSRVFLASGKHDVQALPRPAGTQAGLVGFKMHFRLCERQQAELKDAIELVLFPGGYAGLQPVENGGANLCLLITSKVLRRVGASWQHLQEYLLQVSPHLAGRLRDAEPLFTAPVTVASIPYGFLQTRSADGLWRVGDQAAVIPSFCGDGMAIALHSGVLAARHALQGGCADMFQRALASDLRRRLAIATRLSQTLVELPWLAELGCSWPWLLPRIALMTRIRSEALLPIESVAHG